MVNDTIQRRMNSRLFVACGPLSDDPSPLSELRPSTQTTETRSQKTDYRRHRRRRLIQPDNLRLLPIHPKPYTLYR